MFDQTNATILMSDLGYVRELGVEEFGVSNIGELITHAARKWPEKTAWIFDETGKTYSFVAVERMSRLLATSLQHRGVHHGTVVSLMADNSVYYAVTWLALNRIGARTVPLNTKYQLSDATHVITASGAHLVLHIPEFAPLLNQVREQVDRELELVDLVALFDSLQLEKGASREQSLLPTVQLDTQQLSDYSNIQFTSGTSGFPKGCELTQEYWLTLAWALVNEVPEVSEADRILTAQPFHYIDPQWNVLVGLMSGATLTVLDGFHPTTFWGKVLEYRITYFYCLGMMPSLLLKMPETAHEREHELRLVQASAIPQSIHQALNDRWGVPWVEAFGMTETGADIGVRAADAEKSVGTGIIGSPRRHRQVAIVGENGPVKPGESGRMYLSGPGMIRGYFGQETEAPPPETEYWFDTGDLVSHNGQGQLVFVGRDKDMIRRSGENIAAAEVEAVLMRHPSIHKVAVVGVPDELREEEVMAVCVLEREAGEVSSVLSQLDEFCQQELAAFKIPRYWSFVNELPLTPSERVAKKQLDVTTLQQGSIDLKQSPHHQPTKPVS